MDYVNFSGHLQKSVIIDKIRAIIVIYRTLMIEFRKADDKGASKPLF